MTTAQIKKNHSALLEARKEALALGAGMTVLALNSRIHYYQTHFRKALA